MQLCLIAYRLSLWAKEQGQIASCLVLDFFLFHPLCLRSPLWGVRMSRSRPNAAEPAASAHEALHQRYACDPLVGNNGDPSNGLN